MPRGYRFAVEPVLALVALVVLLLAALETAQLATQYMTLSDVRAAQDSRLSEVIKVRRQVDALAGETARLAASGNANAQAVVDALQRQGITLHAPQSGR